MDSIETIEALTIGEIEAQLAAQGVSIEPSNAEIKKRLHEAREYLRQQVASEVPEPLLIKSTVWTCYHCKAWICRVPQWCGDEGIGECDKCDCTSIVGHEGRPFGPQSQQWNALIEEFREFVRLGMLDAKNSARHDILQSVVMPQSEICQCGHARWEHRATLPAPCNHGRKDPVQLNASHPDYGCRCVGFMPVEKNYEQA